MLTLTLTVYSGDARHTVYGWWVPTADTATRTGVSSIEPIVGNPDGPGIGPWSLYHGEDPWFAA